MQLRFGIIDETATEFSRYSIITGNYNNRYFIGVNPSGVGSRD